MKEKKKIEESWRSQKIIMQQTTKKAEESGSIDYDNLLTIWFKGKISGI